MKKRLYNLSLLVAILFFAGLQSGLAQDYYHADTVALRRLHTSLNGNTWNYPNGATPWFSNANPVTWHGLRFVFTPTLFLRPDTIDLSGLGISGSLPDSLFSNDALTEVRALYLNDAIIPGEVLGGQNLVPWAFGPMGRKLRILDLSRTKILGDSTTLRNLVQGFDSLEVFKADSCLVYFGQPGIVYNLPPLGRLDSLSLANNGLRGIVNLNLLPAIRYLNLSQNELRQLDLYATTGNRNLQELDLSFNQLERIEAPITGATQFANLQKINVTHNRLGFEDLHDLALGFGMDSIGTGTTFDLMPGAVPIRLRHYAPQGVFSGGFVLDTLAFDYRFQVPQVGIGGLRRRPMNETIIINEQSQRSWSNPGTLPYQLVYDWRFINRQGQDSLFGVVAQERGSSLPLLTNLPPSSIVTYAQNSQLNILCAPNNDIRKVQLDSITDIALDSFQIYTLIRSRHFPLQQYQSRPLLIRVGECFDSLNRPIECQQMIIRYQGSVNPQERDSVRQSLGAEVLYSCPCNPDLELWSLPDTINIQLEQDGRGTRSSTSTAQTKPQLLSADPNYRMSWTGGGFNDTIDLSRYPSRNVNPNPTLIALIDAGVDLDHPQLRDRLWVNYPELAIDGNDDDNDQLLDNAWGYDFLNETWFAQDDHGHGTKIAAILGGKTPKSVRRNVQARDSIAVLPLKYTNNAGRGTVFHAACALYHAVDYRRDSAKVQVINASWGYYGEECKVLTQAIEYAHDRNPNLLIVCSAGNDQLDVDDHAQNEYHWPSEYSSSFDNVIAVAALPDTNATNLSSYSNFGRSSIDLAAIGDDLTYDVNNNSLRPAQGTSFATAHVARSAALMFHHKPDACFRLVKRALLEGVDTLPSLSGQVRSAGRLNHDKAFARFLSLSQDTAAVCNTTIGLEEVQPLPQAQRPVLEVWPNPIRGGLVQIELLQPSQDLILELYASDGKLLATRPSQGATLLQWNLEALPAGLYWLRWRTSLEQGAVKLIKP